MDSSLRTGLLIASLLVLALIIITIIKNKMNIKYSVVWILWAIFILLIVIFPDTFFDLTHLVGIEMPSNGVFLIMIGLLYALVFYTYLMITKHNEEIIKLTYEVSVLKKELEELKKNK